MRTTRGRNSLSEMLEGLLARLLLLCMLMVVIVAITPIVVARAAELLPVLIIGWFIMCVLKGMVTRLLR